MSSGCRRSPIDSRIPEACFTIVDKLKSSSALRRCRLDRRSTTASSSFFALGDRPRRTDKSVPDESFDLVLHKSSFFHLWGVSDHLLIGTESGSTVIVDESATTTTTIILLLVRFDLTFDLRHGTSGRQLSKIFTSVSSLFSLLVVRIVECDSPTSMSRSRVSGSRGRIRTDSSLEDQLEVVLV